MPTAANRALERVHNLYLQQLKLFDLLDQDLGDPKMRREARTQVKEFEQLLHGADWRYMGGTDVLEALRQLPEEIMAKLKQSPVSVARAKAGKKRVTKAKVQAKRRR